MSELEELDKILAGCRDGKEAAFEKLYYRFYGFLFSVVRRYARDTDEAKDLVQVSFVRICKNIGKYSQQGSFKSWIKTIAINESINYYKRTNKENRMQFSDDMQYFDSSEAMQVSEDSVLSKLSYEELNNMVLELPDAYRTVFTLYVIDGYKHHEIADMLEIAVSTSKSNLSRAKALLAKRLNSVGVGLKKRLIRNAS